MIQRLIVEKKVGRLETGDAFGDWLASILADRLAGWRGKIRVYRVEPASHVVCRYEFAGTGLCVIGKFFGAPTGAKTRYNTEAAMRNEFRRLRHVSGWIRVPHAIATNSRFNAVLVTEYVPGKTIRELLGAGVSLYEPLTGVAHLLRRLHDGTQTTCKRERDYAYFHAVLDQNALPGHQRKRFDRLLGAWWHGTRLDPDAGCMVHGDATLSNYLFDGETCAIDFEGARNHTHPVRDLGILASELKTSGRSSSRAEDYIGHLLWHYSRSEEEFRRDTAVLPFFMALGYLRIARLPWRAAERDWLLAEAEACLAAIHR
ncbi:MAG TPA: phosphotransferase [Methanoculleus sp.]|nr:phosphotransferase [Methanoculleus sp.]